MKIELKDKITKSDLLVIPFYEGKKPPSSQNVALENQYQGDFEAKANESVMLYQKNKLTPRILLVGLGKHDKSTHDTWRQTGGTVMQHIKKPIQNITILPPKEDIELVSAFMEGMLLSHYKYEAFIRDADRKLHPLENISVIIHDKKIQTELNAQFKAIQIISDAVKTTRDMVNAPSNAMSPTTIAKAAQDIAKKSSKITCKVFDKKKLEKIKMGCLLGVGAGAKEEPRLIILEHKHKPLNKKPIVLIGKGICFDSGGLNIKTRNMEEMKYDMTGAATVLGVFRILAQLKLPLHVIGIAACAENLLGSGATKPGDILTAYDGTTVEVDNTDAEGRLVLCDAIAYAVKHHKPEGIIDIATLTGAAIVALGYDMSAFMTNNEKWGNRIKEAAQTVAEPLWELPTYEGYKKYLKSPIADVTNYSPKPNAGTIMGGLFLEYFTKDTPWAHLDMGGSAWTDDALPYIPKGATGRNVRTLWKFLEDFAK